MRIAGVRLLDGRALWVEAGDRHLSLLDRAVVQVERTRVTGYVFATPEQLIGSCPVVDAILLEVAPPETPSDECEFMPGSELPPLGSTVQTAAGEATVTALDPVRQLVTVRTPLGAQTTVDLAEVLPHSQTRQGASN